MQVEIHVPLVEQILGARSQVIGSQYLPYKNHVYRVINFCFAFRDCEQVEREKLMIAACFHDLGIWPDDTVDYLAPSIALAQQYLHQTNRTEWIEEITLMIDLHHKFRAVADRRYPLVEVFRKGDWVDASLGLRRFGLSRADVRAVQATFPNLGFHKNLMRLGFKQLLSHPLNPLPMMRW
jgi:hypothetical protein